MDKTYQDIMITNWKTKKKFVVRMVKILYIEMDEECMTISYKDEDILHIVTFPKANHELNIS